MRRLLAEAEQHWGTGQLQQSMLDSVRWHQPGAQEAQVGLTEESYFPRPRGHMRRVVVRLHDRNPNIARCWPPESVLRNSLHLVTAFE